jgi:hypothetical protein
MININKQVTKSKISCFLEINQVVLFFHCNNNVSLNKNDILFQLNKIQGVCQTHRKRVTTMYDALSNNPFFLDRSEKDKKDKYETYKKRVFTNQSTFKSLMVKNRPAKKVFSNINTDKFLYFQNQSGLLKKRECLAGSLFQGPTLLLGCSDIKMLERGIDACAKHKGLILLGALYDKSILNHLQVKRLIAYSNNSQGYVRLISSMRNPFLRPFSLIRDLLKMQSLLMQQDRLISLLKAREQQILFGGL